MEAVKPVPPVRIVRIPPSPRISNFELKALNIRVFPSR
jgi:hypothetical protein